MRARRHSSAHGLSTSLLDLLSCGLGAAILLMLLASGSVSSNTGPRDAAAEPAVSQAGQQKTRWTTLTIGLYGSYPFSRFDSDNALMYTQKSALPREHFDVSVSDDPALSHLLSNPCTKSVFGGSLSGFTEGSDPDWANAGHNRPNTNIPGAAPPAFNPGWRSATLFMERRPTGKLLLRFFSKCPQAVPFSSCNHTKNYGALRQQRRICSRPDKSWLLPTGILLSTTTQMGKSHLHFIDFTEASVGELTAAGLQDFEMMHVEIDLESLWDHKGEFAAKPRVLIRNVTASTASTPSPAPPAGESLSASRMGRGILPTYRLELR